MPTIEIMSATTAEAVSSPPAPGPSSVISRIASPCSITALNGPSTAASGWCRSTSDGCTRTSSLPSTSVAGADEAHGHLELARGAHVILCDALDAVELDVVERRARAERDRREDRHLRRRVGAVHVLRRIRLREAEPLRLRERVRVLGALLHLREDEVRRPVDDAEYAMHVRRDERLAQHLDHGDRRADGRLEAELYAALRRRREELGAAARDELLVRRDDGLAGAQQLEDVLAGRLDASHQLGDERDRRVVADRREVGRQHAVVGKVLALAPRLAHERAHDAQPVPGRALDVVGALREQSRHGAADVAVTEQRDGDVDGRHALWRARSGRAPRCTARSTSAARTTHETRIDDVEMISMFTPASASASNMSAATPGMALHPSADQATPSRCRGHT